MNVLPHSRQEGVKVALVLAACCFTMPALALDGGRLRIIDGDTVALGQERIRIADIDAPEIAHPRCPAELRLGLAARDALGALVMGRDVQVTRAGRDRYGRTLAVLSVKGRSIGMMLIASGLAVQWRPGAAAWRARLRHWCGQ